MKVLYAFGLNADGQCGAQKPEDSNCVLVPKPVHFPSKISVLVVSAGSRHTLAISENGDMYSWGWGHLGQLGHGDTISVHSPKLVQALAGKGIISIAAGGMHSGCIDKDHQCYTWGSSTYGQLGLTKETIGLSEVVCSPTLVKISSSDDDSSDFGCDQPFLAKKISCGGMHTGAISTTGDVYCWGRADSGQTGYALWYRNFFPGVLIPRKVMGLDNTAVNISCGGFHTLILTSTGRVYAMGKDDFGMLGVEDTHHTSMAIGVESPTLVTFFNDQSIMSVNAGGWHSCFLTSTGKLYSCGKGEYGRLGVGAEKSFTNPEEVKIDGNVDDCINSVSCGGSHTIFSTTNGKLYTVGRADNGRLGIGETKERMFTTPVDITSSIMTDLEYNIVRVSTGGTHSTVLIDYPNMTDSDYDKAFAK